MAVRKTKAGLALKRWFKEDWKDVRTGRLVVGKKEKSVAHLTADQVNVYHLRHLRLHQKCQHLKKENE